MKLTQRNLRKGKIMNKFKKIISSFIIAASLTSTLAYASDYTYQYSDFVANVVVPQSGLCDKLKSYVGQENNMSASEYFSGIISAFRADLDHNNDMELVLVGDNLVSIYRIDEGAPKFVDSCEVQLICDYGESYVNIFVKKLDGKDYLCAESFYDNSSEKAYSLKMMYISNDKLELANQCNVSKVLRSDYLKESAQAKVGEETTLYSKTVSGGISSSVNPGGYKDLYDAAWQMLKKSGFENPSFLNTVNRLVLEESDRGMNYQLTNLISDIDLKTYVRATGIRTTDKPVVYFMDNSELKTLNKAPEHTAPPASNPTPTPDTPTVSPAPTATPEPTAAPTTAPEQDDTKVTLNGVELDFKDQGACIINDRTLVPMRSIFEALGANVKWLHKYRIVAASKDDIDIFMRIDDMEYYVGEELKKLDVPPQIVNDRTMIPARAVAEALNCTVSWDNATRTVVIKTADYTEVVTPPTSEPAVTSAPAVAP